MSMKCDQVYYLYTCVLSIIFMHHVLDFELRFDTREATKVYFSQK